MIQQPILIGKKAERISWLLCISFFFILHAVAQSGTKTTPIKGAFYTGKYPNLLKEAGYSQADILDIGRWQRRHRL